MILIDIIKKKCIQRIIVVILMVVAISSCFHNKENLNLSLQISNVSKKGDTIFIDYLFSNNTTITYYLYQEYYNYDEDLNAQRLLLRYGLLEELLIPTYNVFIVPSVMKVSPGQKISGTLRYGDKNNLFSDIFSVRISMLILRKRYNSDANTEKYVNFLRKQSFYIRSKGFKL